DGQRHSAAAATILDVAAAGTSPPPHGAAPRGFAWRPALLAGPLRGPLHVAGPDVPRAELRGAAGQLRRPGRPEPAGPRIPAENAAADRAGASECTRSAGFRTAQ